MRKNTTVLPLIATCSFFMFVACFFVRELSCFDIWFHLGAGRYIAEHMSIPVRDIFSFTASNRAWIDHAWLFQLIVYSVFRLAGPDGLVLLRLVVFLMVFGLLFQLGQRRTSILLTALCLIPVVILAHQRHFVRPDMVTLLFVTCYLIILHRYRTTKVIYALLPLQLLWVNMHGYFVLGLVMFLAYLVGGYLRKEMAGRRLLIVGLLLFAVCFINPYSYRVFAHPATSLFEFTVHRSFLSRAIQELRQPLDAQFANPSVVWYRIAAATSALLMLLSIRRIHIGECIVYVIFFIMSASSFRHVGLFSVIAGMMMVTTAGDVFRQQVRRRAGLLAERWRQPVRTALYLVLICSMLTVAVIKAGEAYYVAGTTFKNVNFGISQLRYPHGLTPIMQRKDVGGNIFNTLDLGAFLIGTAYPQCRVFIDGRTELYGVDFLRRYREILRGEISFDDIAAAHDIRYVAVTRTGAPPAFLKKLYQSRQWRLIYFDGTATVFARAMPEHSALIAEQEIALVEPALALSPLDIEQIKRRRPYPFFHLARSCFYRDIGMVAFAVKEIEHALLISPDCGECYYALGELYRMKGLHADAQNAYSTARQKGYTQ